MDRRKWLHSFLGAAYAVPTVLIAATSHRWLSLDDMMPCRDVTYWRRRALLAENDLSYRQSTIHEAMANIPDDESMAFAVRENFIGAINQLPRLRLVNLVDTDRLENILRCGCERQYSHEHCLDGSTLAETEVTPKRLPPLPTPLPPPPVSRT